jgi:hypothetical protein
MLVEALFQYRSLLGKCELGCGLEWDEIEELARIEHEFAEPEPTRGRKFRREPVAISGFLRGARIHDRVEIVELSLGGLVCRGAPFIARGAQVEVLIEIGELGYRFRSSAMWLRDDGDDYRVALAFHGTPVCLHHVQLRRHEQDVIDQIRAAAA